jgi:CBS domain-containing protein
MLKADEIMTKDVVTIRSSASVAEAVILMKDKVLRALIVEPHYEGDPYGIVSETDIVYKVAAYGHDPKQMRVHEIMTKPCVVVNPELGVEYVARLFANTGIQLALVIKGQLLGIISIRDILRKGDFAEKPNLNYSPTCAILVVAKPQKTDYLSGRSPDSFPSKVFEGFHESPKIKQVKSYCELYCEENPGVPEVRIYED